MCGLLTIITREIKTSLPSQILSLYQLQKNRGSEGFGFVAIDNKLGVSMSRSEEEKDITKKLSKYDKKTLSAIIFHHRFPTSTPNYHELAHPIKISNKDFKFDYYVIHNGIISNDDELHTQHQKEGLKYTTELKEITKTSNRRIEILQYNDSECLAIELAKLIESKDKDKTLEHVKGSIAFILVQATKKGKAIKLFYGRNYQSPLKVSGDSDNYYLASEGKGENITTNTLFCLNLQTMVLSQTPCRIGDKCVYSKKYGYDDNDEWIDYKYNGKEYERKEEGYSNREQELDDMCYGLMEGGEDADFFYPEMYSPDLLDISKLNDEEIIYKIWEAYDKRERQATSRGHTDTADWYYGIKIDLEGRLYEIGKLKG